MIRFVLIMAGLFFVFSIAAADVNDVSYGNAIVAKVIDCNQADDYSFVCDIRNYPPIIGRNIPVKIRGIGNLTADSNLPNVAKRNNFVEDNLKKAKRIELKNMQRGDGFFVLADVYCDGQDLGKLLVEKNFASVIDNSINKQNITNPAKEKDILFVGSKSGKVFHLSSCRWSDGISQQNIENYTSRQEAIDRGKRPCKTCKP